MKSIFIYSFFLIVSNAPVCAQEKFSFSKHLKDQSGKTVRTDTLLSKGSPLVLDFWAIWCKPCIIKFNSLVPHYERLQKETGVRIIAVSIDRKEDKEKALAMALKYKWPFELYFDESKTFFKSVTREESVPHSFFVNGKGELIADKTGIDAKSKTKGKGVDVFSELYEKGSRIEEFEADLTEYFDNIRKLVSSGR